jgi:D-alanine-D-alanine ligase
MSRVAVLEGSRSLERQVSLKTGARVKDALGRLGHEVISFDGDEALIEGLRAARPDVAFVALHGRDGEDGTIQGLLELLSIPYTGSRPYACMRAADKVLAKHALREAGIPTPDFYAFSEAAFRELGAAGALPEIEQRLTFPIVVKPAFQGSALGLKIAQSPDEVPAALMAAFSYDRKVVLERHVPGRDLAVSILDGVALPIVEALVPDGHLYDFDARYEIGRTDFTCPAALEPAVAHRVAEVALSSWEALGLTGFARVDLMLEGDRPYVLEANPVPGLTETSLLPQAAEAAGIGFDALIGRLLEGARAERAARL